MRLEPDNIRTIIDTGMNILRAVNDQEVVAHPELDIHSVDLVEFYGKADRPEATMKNAVVFGNIRSTAALRDRYQRKSSVAVLAGEIEEK